jgi:hypothetical protein
VSQVPKRVLPSRTRATQAAPGFISTQREPRGAVGGQETFCGLGRNRKTRQSDLAYVNLNNFSRLWGIRWSGVCHR